MNREFDETVLSSYMDGELEPQSMRRIEALIEKDADARRYILNAVKTAARLKASLNGILSEKIPERLTRTIHSQESIKSNRFFPIGYNTPSNPVIQCFTSPVCHPMSPVCNLQSVMIKPSTY